MDLHPEKCPLPRNTNKEKSFKTNFYNNIHNTRLSEAKHVKYFGVITDSKGQWKEQNKAIY